MVTFVIVSAAEGGASDESGGDGDEVSFSWDGLGESTMIAFVFVVADAFAFESAAQCGASDDSDSGCDIDGLVSLSWRETGESTPLAFVSVFADSFASESAVEGGASVFIDGGRNVDGDGDDLPSSCGETGEPTMIAHSLALKSAVECRAPDKGDDERNGDGLEPSFSSSLSFSFSCEGTGESTIIPS